MSDGQMSALLEDFSWERVQVIWPEILSCLATSRLRTHPLGFLHTTLLETKHAALRFHAWRPGMRPVQQPAWLTHTHIFELRSIVLFGRLKNSIFEWSEESHEPEARLYEVSYVDGVSRITATDRLGNVNLKSSSDVHAGVEYSVPYGSFHQTAVSEDLFTATIALTRKRSGSPLVVGTVDGDTFYCYARNELTPELRDEVVAEITESLGKWPPNLATTRGVEQRENHFG
jgi:hypothetical protein